MKDNFEELGFWFIDEDSNPLVRVDGVLYTLYGWNGKTHQFSRKVLDLEKKEVSHTLYCVTPEYIDLNDEFENMEIVGYEVSLY